MLSRRKYLITTGSAVSIMAIAGCSTPTDSENNEEDTQDGSSTEETDSKNNEEDTQDGSSTEETGEETNPENQVQIVEHELVEDPDEQNIGVNTIEGVVENNSEEEVGPVTVDITLIDENGEEFEPSSVTGNTEFAIEPNSRWEFEADMAYDGEFEEYNLSLVFAS